MNEDLLREFCTPPALPLSDFDAKVLADACPTEFPFEGYALAGYAWGEGRPVLLLHGWGSRASHLALIGRLLARSGFKAIAFDAPAHSSIRAVPEKPRSSMFEYGRALGAVASRIGPLYGIVGHSFGAMCAAFAAAGLLAFAEHRVEAEKLVLISTPPDLAQVLRLFCERDGRGDSILAELRASLEAGFDFSIDGYSVAEALGGIGSDLLLVHDASDEEVPIEGARALSETARHPRLFVTEGSGHQRILMNRGMMAEIKSFLETPPIRPDR